MPSGPTSRTIDPEAAPVRRRRDPGHLGRGGRRRGARPRRARTSGLVASPTRAAVVRELAARGAASPEERIAALRAPAGMDLGAETAEEVALSILAELVQVRRGTAPFVASPGPATLAGASPASRRRWQPVVDDIVLLDPVCGMTVDRAHARHLAEHEGVVYAFCSHRLPDERSSASPSAYVAGVGTTRPT